MNVRQTKYFTLENFGILFNNEIKRKVGRNQATMFGFLGEFVFMAKNAT